MLKAGNHDFRRRKEGDSGLYNKIRAGLSDFAIRVSRNVV